MADNARTPDDGSYSHSLDCVDFYLDGPGDHTVRPIPPEGIAQVRELRDRLLAAEKAGIDLSEQEFIFE